MVRSDIENAVKSVLIGLLKAHNIAVDRAQEIASGVLTYLDTEVSSDASFEVSKDMSIDVIDYFVDLYPELSSIREEVTVDSVEKIEQSLAEDLADLIEQGQLDMVIALGSKIDDCEGEESCVVGIEKEADSLLHSAVIATPSEASSADVSVTEVPSVKVSKTLVQ